MRKILACALVSNPDAIPVEGSIQSSCCVCERAIWIAPSSIKLMEQYQDFTPYCDPDAHAFMAQELDIPVAIATAALARQILESEDE